MAATPAFNTRAVTTATNRQTGASEPGRQAKAAALAVSASTLAPPPGWRLAAAGSLSGALTNTLLHPLDTVKTVRQSNPTAFKGLAPTITSILRSRGLAGLYLGIVPALVGSSVSTALYFSMYELVKHRMSSSFPRAWNDRRSRIPLTAVSAACGNVASSIVFVPKEVIKQRLQFTGQQLQSGVSSVGGTTAVQPQVHVGDVIRQLFNSSRAGSSSSAVNGVVASARAGTQSATAAAGAVAKVTSHIGGIGAFYRGYKATLLRNIPSAMIRFAAYEEFKMILKRMSDKNNKRDGTNGQQRSPQQQQPLKPHQLVLAGSMAGALSSACTTPMDVVKTRFATGVIPPGTSLPAAFTSIIKRDGAQGLFVGIRPRMLWAALFSAVGFTSYEMCKALLTGQPSPFGLPRSAARTATTAAVASTHVHKDYVDRSRTTTLTRKQQ